MVFDATVRLLIWQSWNLPSPSPRLCLSTAGNSPPTVSSIVFCLLLFLSRWFPPSLLCCLAIFCMAVLLISSVPLVATLCQRLLHLLSFILAICPSHLHFCFSVYSVMSIIFVLFLISEHGILSCSFRPNLSSPLLFERFLFCQLFIEGPRLAAMGQCWQDTLVHYLFIELNKELSVLKYFFLFFPFQSWNCILFKPVNFLTEAIRRSAVSFCTGLVTSPQQHN